MSLTFQFDQGKREILQLMVDLSNRHDLTTTRNYFRIIGRLLLATSAWSSVPFGGALLNVACILYASNKYLCITPHS